MLFAFNKLLRFQTPQPPAYDCRQEQSPMLISIIGMDSAGDLLLSHWHSLHLSCNGILRKAGVATSMTAYTFNQGTIICIKTAAGRHHSSQQCHSHCTYTTQLMTDCTSLLQTAFAAGEVAASVADVRTVEEHLRPTDLQQFHMHIQQAGILVLDANLSPKTIQVSKA